MIGDRIKDARQRRGWTQADLAHHSGVDQAYISQIERGRRQRISGDILAKLAAALDMTMDQLMQGTQPPDTTQPPEELFRAVFSAGRVQEILELWDQLSIKERLELIEIATDMKRRLEEGNRRAESLLYHHPPLFNPAFDK